MCGVVGVYDREDAAALTVFGLDALQHRGQESAGAVTSDGENIRRVAGMGLVSQVFNDKNIRELKGHHAVGHVRYSTQGSSKTENAQPKIFTYKGNDYVPAHNGNLKNAAELTDALEDNGSILQTEVDTEALVHRFVRAKGDSLDRLIDAVDPNVVRGSYSMLFMDRKQDTMYAVRDIRGINSLCLGEFEDGGYAVASEDIAFRAMGAKFVREIKNGEVLKISNGGVESFMPWGEGLIEHPCSVDFLYFASPASKHLYGMDVARVRKALGRCLARERKVDADIVAPMPDTGIFGALGYSEESGIPYDMAFLRHPYATRTFIMPTQKERELAVGRKLIPIESVVEGKNVILIEDTIIRGTTSKNTIRSLLESGAKNVFMEVYGRPFRYPCYNGKAFSNPGKLIANKLAIRGIRKEIGAKGLHFNSEEGILEAMGYEKGKREFCYECMGGKPVDGNERPYCNRKC